MKADAAEEHRTSGRSARSPGGAIHCVSPERPARPPGVHEEGTAGLQLPAMRVPVLAGASRRRRADGPGSDPAGWNQGWLSRQGSPWPRPRLTERSARPDLGSRRVLHGNITGRPARFRQIARRNWPLNQPIRSPGRRRMTVEGARGLNHDGQISARNPRRCRRLAVRVPATILPIHDPRQAGVW